MIRLPLLPAPVLRTLLDCATEEDRGDDAVLAAKYFRDPASLEELWAEHRDILLAAWVEEYPGTRPSLWWYHDAPGAPHTHRRLLGGSGRPCAVMPVGGLPYLMQINPVVPAIVEAEAEFLRRHQLLLPGEVRRLRPEDFEPEELEDGEP